MNDKKQITFEDLDFDLETLQAYMDRERALNAARKKHSYVGDLIQELMGRPNAPCGNWISTLRDQEGENIGWVSSYDAYESNASIGANEQITLWKYLFSFPIYRSCFGDARTDIPIFPLISDFER